MPMRFNDHRTMPTGMRVNNNLKLPTKDLIARYSMVEDGNLIDTRGSRGGQIYEGLALQGDGTRYIDTGIVPNQDTEVELIFTPNSVNSNEFLFGVLGDGASENFRLKFNDTAGGLAGTFGDKTVYTTMTLERHKIHFSKAGIFIDDILKGNFTGYTFNDSGLTMPIMAFNNAGAIGFQSKITIEKAEIVHNGVTYTYTCDSTTGTNSDFPYLFNTHDLDGTTHAQQQNSTLSTSFSVNNDADSNYNEVGGTVSAGKINEVENYDFSDGVNGWSVWGSTLAVSNKILSVIGDGTFVGVSVFQNNTMKVSAEDILYFYFKGRITNTDFTQASMYIDDGVVQTQINKTQSEFIPNVWNEFDSIVTIPNTGDIKFELKHQYVDTATANGKVMEVDGNAGVFAFNLTKLNKYYPEYNLLTKTADEIKAIKEELQAKQLYLDTLATIPIPLGVKIPAWGLDNSKICAFLVDGTRVDAVDRGRVKYNGKLVSGIVDLATSNITTITNTNYEVIDFDNIRVYSSSGTYRRANTQVITSNDPKLLVSKYLNNIGSANGWIDIYTLGGAYIDAINMTTENQEFRKVFTPIDGGFEIRCYSTRAVDEIGDKEYFDTVVYEASLFTDPLTDPLPPIDFPTATNQCHLVPPKCPALIQADIGGVLFDENDNPKLVGYETLKDRFYPNNIYAKDIDNELKQIAVYSKDQVDPTHSKILKYMKIKMLDGYQPLLGTDGGYIVGSNGSLIIMEI